MADHRGRRRLGRRPEGRHRLRRRAVRVADGQGRHRPRALVRGREVVRRARAADRRRGRPRHRPAAGRHGGGTGRLLRLCRPGRLLRRTGPGHPRERRRPGERRDPDAVRARSPRPRSTSHGSMSSYHTSSSTSCSTRPSTTRTTSRRAGSTRASPSTSARAYNAGYRSEVEAAARGGRLIPLDGLVGQFPTGQGFFLAYAESVSAVDFLIRTHTARRRSSS